MSVEIARDGNEIVISCSANDEDIQRLPELGTTLRFVMKEVSESEREGDENFPRYWLQIWLRPVQS